MTHDEIIQIERGIRAYNKKGWKGSTGAVLLHKAWKLIDHYKDANKAAYTQSNFLEDRVIELEGENAALRKEGRSRCFNWCESCQTEAECTIERYKTQDNE